MESSALHLHDAPAQDDVCGQHDLDNHHDLDDDQNTFIYDWSFSGLEESDIDHESLGWDSKFWILLFPYINTNQPPKLITY